MLITTALNLKTALNVLKVSVLIFIIIYASYNIIDKKSVFNKVPLRLQYDECRANNTPIPIGDLWETVERLNEQREVKHWQKYGPVNSGTPVIVIQVHKDAERLQYLIISLAQVIDIQSVLLIFSHSFYDECINYLIQQIDFCMVLQLYYPNSVQLYPNNFPGLDSGDCVWSENGTSNTDGYCVERDARVSEAKHHWWWTANVVFDELAWSAIYEDMVMFIDEQTYVLPDLLHMFRASKSSLNYVPDVNVLAFGRILATDLDYNKLTVDIWKPLYDKGLAFNKTTWRKIVSLNEFYCQFDDASWSYSLMHLFEKFPRGRAVMVACMLPRVISTGTYSSGKEALENIMRITQRQQMFPNKVQLVMLFGQSGRVVSHYKPPPHGNGGWSDSRDHQLCLEPLITTLSNDITIDSSTISNLQFFTLTESST